MIAHTIMILATAASLAFDPAGCRRTSSGRTAAAAWESDGKGHLSVSMDARSVGEVSLDCKVRMPPGTEAVTLGFDHAWVSFQPSGGKQAGSGLILALGATCQGSLTRVAGEDWIEARKRSWTLPVGAGQREIRVRVIARDSSDRDPVRIDLTGLRLVFETVHGESGPGAPPCQ